MRLPPRDLFKRFARELASPRIVSRGSPLPLPVMLALSLALLAGAPSSIGPGSARSADNALLTRIGSVAANLAAPTGVAVDAAEHVYVSESSRNRLLVFDSGGRFLGRLEGLAKPLGVAVDGDGRIYVCCAGGGNVSVYDGGLRFVRKLGRGDGEFRLPAAVAVAPSGDIYVVDARTGQVKVYRRNGQARFAFGAHGNEDGNFNFPTSIAIDAAGGSIVVADLQCTADGIQGARIQLFDDRGRFRKKFGSYGRGPGLLAKPMGTAFDRGGRILVADASQNVVQVFDGGGSYRWTVYDLGRPLRTPLGLATGKRTGRLYVASLNTSTVEVYGGPGDVWGTVDEGGTGDGGGSGFLSFYSSSGGGCSVSAGGRPRAAAAPRGGLFLLLPVLIWLFGWRRIFLAAAALCLAGTSSLALSPCSAAALKARGGGPAASISSYGNIFEYPHSATNDIGCESCHYPSNPVLPVEWMTFTPQNIDDTLYNDLCRQCHNDVVAPYVRTHSSLATDNGYGDWSIECRDCHEPHTQHQKDAYGSASYLYQGIVSAISDNSLRRAGAGWADNQFRGFSVFPDAGPWPYVSYKIVRNDGDTLYAQGPMDLTKAAAGSTFVVTDGKLLRNVVATPSAGDRTVRFFRESGANSFADGDGAIDGVCQVCHARTGHHRADGSDAGAHNAATKCTTCHPHAEGFKGSGGNSGAHLSHAALMACDGGSTGCHGASSPPLMADGLNLRDTARCDACHSPGGSYDGVNDPAIGCKANWTSGASLVYAGGSLFSGKEKWCAGCHDESPSLINGVSAPNVVGNENAFYAYGRGWGYYRTGHGLASGVYPSSTRSAAALGCGACHDLTTPHIDNNPRTYRAADNNYQAAYRLKRPMDIPRGDVGQPASDFQLCLDCHSAATYLTQTDNTTNFRKDPTIPNSHWLHLQAPPTGQFAGGGWWDSDWDGVGDSKLSCPACHNVHGSPSPGMLQHGELISTPGTTDRVPAFGARYYPFAATPYPPLPNSTGLGFYPAPPYGQGTVANTGVCIMCHANNVAYYRTVTDPPPRIRSVHGRAGANTLTVVFSEGVYTNPGASGALAAGDFAYTDQDDGRTVAGATHVAGSDTASVTLSSALDASNDVGADTLAAATASSIYDNAGKAMGTSAVIVSGEGPLAQSLHPDNLVYNGAAFTPSSTPSGGTWPYVLDSYDGDNSFVFRSGIGAGSYFTMAMDNGSGLGPASIQGVTIRVRARHLLGAAPYAAYVQVGYQTGTNLVWGAAYQTDLSGDYNLVSADYATNSDGGGWTAADIDNLRVSVMRGNTNGNNSCITRVTEIEVIVRYSYPQ